MRRLSIDWESDSASHSHFNVLWIVSSFSSFLASFLFQKNGDPHTHFHSPKFPRTSSFKFKS